MIIDRLSPTERRRLLSESRVEIPVGRYRAQLMLGECVRCAHPSADGSGTGDGWYDTGKDMANVYNGSIIMIKYNVQYYRCYIAMDYDYGLQEYRVIAYRAAAVGVTGRRVIRRFPGA